MAIKQHEGQEFGTRFGNHPAKKKKKTDEERLQEIQKKEAQLKAQKQRIKNKHKEEQRKKDTSRKLLIGTKVESVLGRELTDDEIPKLVDFLRREGRNGNFFINAMNERM